MRRFTEYSDITFTLDMANQRLDISIPQSLLARNQKAGCRPQPDHGVNGLLFDYNLFASTYRPNAGGSTENLNSYGTAG